MAISPDNYLDDPKKSGSGSKTINLPVDVHTKLKKLAHRKETNMVEMVRYALQAAEDVEKGMHVPPECARFERFWRNAPDYLKIIVDRAMFAYETMRE